MINSSDITFLCLPDAAAIEAASLCTNPDVRIIDASTAHRTNPAWTMVSLSFPKSIERISAIQKELQNPGCYASGFISLVYPLVKAGVAS